MSNYYFGALLPALTMQGPAPMSFADFVMLCNTHLPPADQQAVSQLSSPTPVEYPANDLIADWSNSETQLRNAVTRIRATRTEKDATQFLKTHQSFSTSIEKGATDAFTKSTPLQREMALDAIRWEFLDEHAGLDQFATRAILAYGLKLQIVERWAGLDDAAGRDAAESAMALSSDDNNKNNAPEEEI